MQEAGRQAGREGRLVGRSAIREMEQRTTAAGNGSFYNSGFKGSRFDVKKTNRKDLSIGILHAHSCEFVSIHRIIRLRSKYIC